MTRLVLHAALLLSCATVLIAQDDPHRDAWARVDEYARARMRDVNTPGMSLAITARDRLLYVGTYGFANIDAGDGPTFYLLPLNVESVVV